MDKINKLSLPATILIGCILLGGFYYFAQVNKQNSIEKQQKIELAERKEQQEREFSEKKEQQEREFSASQKESCLSIYKQESSKWNNTTGWRYDEDEDVCYIEYKSDSKRTDTECNELYQDGNGNIYPWALNSWFLCKEGLFEKAF